MVNWVKIDKENIEPTLEVLAINEFDDFLLGFIHYDEDQEMFICENDHELLENVTHFVEKKDINLPNALSNPI